MQKETQLPSLFLLLYTNLLIFTNFHWSDKLRSGGGGSGSSLVASAVQGMFRPS